VPPLPATLQASRIPLKGRPQLFAGPIGCSRLLLRPGIAVTCLARVHSMVRHSYIRLGDAVPDPGERLLDVTIPGAPCAGGGAEPRREGVSKRVNRCSPLTLLRDRTATERPCWLPAVTRSKSRLTPFVPQPLLVVPARSDLDSRSWPAVKIKLASASTPCSTHWAEHPGSLRPSSSAAS
jgi:hypothetical protein